MIKIKRITIIISLVFALLLTACGNGESSDVSQNSDAQDVFAENSSQSVTSGELSDNSKDEDVSFETSIEVSSSEETDSEKSADDIVDNFMKSAFEKVSFNYNVKTELEFDGIVALLECYLSAENTSVFSHVILTVDGKNLINRTNYYEQGQAFLYDNLLGNVRFQTTRNEFLSFISDFDPYYYLTECATDFAFQEKGDTSEENDTIQYSLTKDIVTHQSLILLFNSANAENIVFQNGSFAIDFDKEYISCNSAFSEINGTAFKESKETPFNVKISISTENQPSNETETPPYSDYKNFFTYKNYIFSKSTHKLSELDAYEIFVTTRAYRELADGTKTYYDLSLSYAASLIDNIQSHLIFNLESTVNQTNETYKYNNKDYTRAYKAGAKIPKFKITDANKNFSPKDTVSLWNVAPFDITTTSNYTISETETYYVIDYTYNVDTVKNIVVAQNSFWTKLLPDFKYISDKEVSNVSTSTIKKASGKIIIRKSDFIMVENSFDISVTTSDKKTFRIINQIETISVNENVVVSKPE